MTIDNTLIICEVMDRKKARRIRKYFFYFRMFVIAAVILLAVYFL